MCSNQRQSKIFWFRVHEIKNRFKEFTVKTNHIVHKKEVFTNSEKYQKKSLLHNLKISKIKCIKSKIIVQNSKLYLQIVTYFQ